MNPKDLVGAKKAPIRYVPPALVIGVAPALEVGALKYGPFNWREQPVSMVTYIEAIDRHMAALKDGQDAAEDTGVDHLGHIGASVAILLDAKANGTLLDDRYKPGPAADMLRSLDKSIQPPELCVCHTPGVPLGDVHVAFVTKHGCSCPAYHGEHFLTCPAYR